MLVRPQDYSYRLSVVISEQSGQMQELRKQLSLTEEELRQVKRDKERMTGAEAEHLQSLLREKEAFIKVCVPRVPRPPGSPGSNRPWSLTLALFCQELMRAQEEATLPKDSEAEAEALQEELQLLLRKEKEAQVFVTVCGLFFLYFF